MIEYDLERYNENCCVMKKAFDITDQSFGRLTAKRMVDREEWKGKGAEWICQCQCGNTIQAAAHHLKAGSIKSCGCYQREVNTKHAMSDTSEYGIWANMKTRCLNPLSTYYELYGGRGIRVCSRWLNSFENFFADMGPRPSPEHSLDRIDGQGHYEPSNCRWATMAEQSRNRSSNIMVDFQGKQVCLTDAAIAVGINPKTVIKRRLSGWQKEDWLIPVGAARQKPLLPPSDRLSKS